MIVWDAGGATAWPADGAAGGPEAHDDRGGAEARAGEAGQGEGGRGQPQRLVINTRIISCIRVCA